MLYIIITVGWKGATIEYIYPYTYIYTFVCVLVVLCALVEPCNRLVDVSSHFPQLIYTQHIISTHTVCCIINMLYIVM